MTGVNHVVTNSAFKRLFLVLLSGLLLAWALLHALAGQARAVYSFDAPPLVDQTGESQDTFIYFPVVVRYTHPQAYMVKDMNVQPLYSPPSQLTTMNGTLLFTLSAGYPLMRSDGTITGTFVIHETPVEGLTAGKDTLYFFSDTGLWKSDGTQSGTVLVKDLDPYHFSYEITPIGDLIYFVLTDGVVRQLWRSDGTQAGTFMITPEYPFSGEILGLTDVNGTLFFIDHDYQDGNRLWKSDTTRATLVKDYPGSEYYYLYELTNVNGILFFIAEDIDHEYELWKSNGTEIGTSIVKNLGGSDSVISYPANLIDVDGTLFFSATDRSSSTYLWKSDGTPAGTVAIKPVKPASLYAANGILYFMNDNGGQQELWKSDGTPEGTLLVKNLGCWVSKPQMILVNDTLFFNACDSSHGEELWKSDGTQPGTALVKDITPGPRSSNLMWFVDMNGTLIFTAYDNLVGGKVWKSDGTAYGTLPVYDLTPGNQGSSPQYLVGFHNALYFINGRFTNEGDLPGRAIWKTDGTITGTTTIKDFSGETPYFLKAFGYLYYYDVTQDVLWRSDGTAAGTVPLKKFPSIGEGKGWQPGVYEFNRYNGTVVFNANTDEFGYELWKTDGTITGTVLVKDLIPGPGSGFPSFLTPINNMLYFTVYNPDGTDGLWKTDGSEAGTVLIKGGFHSGFHPYDGPFTGYLTPAGNTLYFVADDGIRGQELWKSDGTQAGTVMVHDINPGSESSIPFSLTYYKGILYFFANRGELWKSDGTESGTVQIKDSFYPASNLTVANGYLFFSNSDTQGNHFLWRSDGTEAGTLAIGSFQRIDHLTSIKDLLYFSADDGIHGEELWTSDGSPSGTEMIADIYPGFGPSHPSDFTRVNNTVFFVADDGFRGRELWALK